MNKIDLIIDALEQYVNVVVSHNDPNNLRVRVKDGGEPARKALAAARELKEIDSKLEKAREKANKVWEQATGKQI